MSQPAPGLPTGHPHYEVLERCGQGGMGVVYRARDKRLNREVALKFLSAPDSPDALARFRQEAEAVAALNHPNIATLFEPGDWDGAPFLAMELLTGGTLRDRRRAGGLPLSEILSYAKQLGEALAFAHSEGIIHRDVKPGNAMFNARGTLKLLDFGLAKSSGFEDLTQAGAVVGTPSYMAPELLGGAEASVRSDLFSFAALVYEMASGESIHSKAGVGLAGLRPDFPEGVSRAVAKALARDPGDRFVSVRAFLDELDLAASGDNFALTRTMTVTVAQEPAKKNRRRWRGAAYGAAALALAAGAAIHWWPAGRSPARVATQTLVVLPFENLAGDPANQALCDGLQETVASLLSGAPELRSSTMIVPASELRRGQVRTIVEAQRQFNATLAVTGSVVRTGGNIQITLNLSDTSPVRQKNSRIISVPASEAARLQEQLGADLGALLGRRALGNSPASAGETTMNSAAYDSYLRGRGELEGRHYDEAVSLLTKAVEADPDFATARAKLSEALVRKYLYTRDSKFLALADAEAARASVAGPIPAVVLAQALIRRATGKSDEAIALFSQLVKSEPGNVDAFKFLAEEYALAGRPKEAEETYLAAIRLRPGYWPLHQGLGNFYMGERQYAKAGEAFETAIALAPQVAGIPSDMGAMYYRMGKWPEAAAAFEKSIAIKPNAVAYANLGAVLFYQGRYEEAARRTETATELQPANATNWGNLGDARWQLPGGREKARAAFRKAADLAAGQLALNPGNFQIRKTYALYLAKLGRAEEAQQEAGKAMAQAPNDGGVHFYAARALVVAGATAPALEALSRAAELGYDSREIAREPDFEKLRNLPRYREIIQRRP